MNDNTFDLSQCKGEVIPCPFCRPEEVHLGRACQHCMGHFYLAKCKNCNATGKETKGAAWDGGKSSHTSTCTPCGGTGYYPARKEEYVPQYAVRTAREMDIPASITTIPGLMVRRSPRS